MCEFFWEGIVALGHWANHLTTPYKPGKISFTVTQFAKPFFNVKVVRDAHPTRLLGGLVRK